MNKLQSQIIQARDEYVATNGVEPKYADVLVKFNGESKAENEIIRILDESEKGADTESFVEDDEIFFYVENVDKLIELCAPDNGEDFQVIDFTDFFEEL